MTSHEERSPRVVLADDHPSVLSAFARMLRADCEVVATVSTGAEAVEVTIRLRPDVLVVDLMMRDLDGLEVCRRVKQAVPDTDVIIVTAFDDPPVQSAAMLNGAAAFVAKPETPKTLVKTIQRIFADKAQKSARIE